MKMRGKVLKNHIYMFKVVARNEWSYLLVLFFYILLSYVAPLVMIIFPKYILDDLTTHQPMEVISNRIALMVLSYLVIHLTIQGLSVIKNNLELKLKVDLNIKLSEKCLRLEYSDLESNEVINTINNAKVAVSGGLTYAQSIGLSGGQGVTGYFTQLADMIANVLKISTYIYILSELQLWLIGIIILGLVLNCKCSLIKKRANVDLRNYTVPFLRKNQYCNRVLRSFEAGKDIRVYHLQDYLLTKFSECNTRYVNAKNEYKAKFVLADIVSVLCSVGVTFFVYLSLIFLLLNGKVSVGQFTMISSATISLFGCGVALIAEGMNLDILSIYMMDFKKIMSREEKIWTGKRHLVGNEHKIVFKNVSFTYNNSDEEVLHDINIMINSGDTISIVGSNGAGKSTFIKLLTGLYQPTKGTIYIDGFPMQEYCRKEIVNSMSVLFQDFGTYAMTVKENVSMATECEQSLFEKCIEESGIKSRIDKMPQRGDTSVLGLFGEGDENLSGGEEQKLALARAFYKNSDMLILDEPTAALDALAECEIYQHMFSYVKDKTVLFVSHRMACTRFCKRVIVFDKGKIVEDGCHDTLVKQDGLYAMMWNAQAKYYEKEGNGNEEY